MGQPWGGQGWRASRHTSIASCPRYDTSLLRILTLRDSRIAEETCKYCGEKREPQENTE
jgi:hypothetical protein